MNIKNLENNERKYVSSLGNFHVLEYQSDASVAPENARNEYFMSKMGVRRRQPQGSRESVILSARWSKVRSQRRQQSNRNTSATAFWC